MPVPSYAWVYSDPFHFCYVAATTILSLLSNGLLLLILSSNASSTIGSYRYLLAVFAICDLITSAAHAILIPVSDEHVVCDVNRELSLANWTHC